MYDHTWWYMMNYDDTVYAKTNMPIAKWRVIIYVI